MDWIKTNYDRAILVTCVLALLASSGYVIWQSNTFQENFSNRKNAKAPNNSVKPFNVDKVVEASTLASHPTTLTPHDGSLLVSRIYVLKDRQLVDPLESDVEIHPPIKNAWIQKYSLDFSDSNLKDADPDGDGFTNLEEFLGGTDPTDPNSHPPFYTKLRLLNFVSQPFVLKFNGDLGDETYAINFRTAARPKTQMVKIGDTIQGAPYKVVSYEKKSVLKNELDVDVSELVVQNTENGQKIVLVQGKDTNDPTSFAEFVFLIDGSKFRVKKDEEFSLKPEPDKKYKLVEVSAQEAQIQDVTNGNKIRIGRPE